MTTRSKLVQQLYDGAYSLLASAQIEEIDQSVVEALAIMYPKILPDAGFRTPVSLLMAPQLMRRLSKAYIQTVCEEYSILFLWQYQPVDCQLGARGKFQSLHELCSANCFAQSIVAKYCHNK